MNWKGSGRKRPWPDLMCCAVICLQKTMNTLSYGSGYPNPHRNLPNTKAEVLPHEPTSSVGGQDKAMFCLFVELGPPQSADLGENRVAVVSEASSCLEIRTEVCLEIRQKRCIP